MDVGELGERSVAAGNSRQHRAFRRSDRRHMLIARDLAEADDGDGDGEVGS